MRTRREERALHVRDWRRSGQTAREFASSIGVNPSTLSYWAWRLGRETGTTVAASKRVRSSRPAPASFVEILGEALTDGRFELELPGGRRLHIPARFDRAALEQLLAVLENGR
jgi:transposase